MWYTTGPYWAYYYTGRYYDVLNLADITLNAISEQVLEESFYWRALAKQALGDTDGAIADLRTALSAHPNWEPALYQLDLLGATP
jgi:tetratricopeptide (TPR) repeat protein